MHAAGNAVLAFAAGKCAGALTGGGGLLAGGSTGAAFDPRQGDALALACLGLGAIGVKALGGVWAAWEEARICGDVGAALRLRVLDGWLAQHGAGARAPGPGEPSDRTTHTRLRHARHSDQGSEPAQTDHVRGASPLAAMTEHVRELEAGLEHGVLGAVRAALQLAPLVAMLAWMEPRLALAAGGAFVLFAAALGRARRAWKRANARGAEHRDALLGAADEAVKHAELWTTYGAERRVRAHVASIGESLAAQAAKLAASASALSGANEALGATALVLAIAAARAGWLGEAHEAGLLPFAVTFFLAYRPIRDLTDARLALGRSSVAADAIAPLLKSAEAAAKDRSHRPSSRSSVADADLSLPRAWPLSALTLDALVLARGSGEPISLRVEPGSIVAVVGPTGCGKTTLLRTLLGLELPVAGELRYGEERLDEASAGPRDRPFAWVPQDAPVLADTLDANVALADGASDPRDALAAIGASRLVRELGDARLGAGGRRVSGGERQWIALARAVATRLPVLLLDEPTSGLDTASQSRVLDAIARLRGERTVILVTHREEPLAIADRVVRLEAHRDADAIARAS